MRNALISFLAGGLLMGLLGGLVFGLFFGQGKGPVYDLGAVLIWGLGAAPILALKNGGFAYLKHYVLRLLLWRNGYAPWNYVRFLDHAAERVFLRKVGGGYIFTHRLLMEYFATLQPTDPARQPQTA